MNNSKSLPINEERISVLKTYQRPNSLYSNTSYDIIASPPISQSLSPFISETPSFSSDLSSIVIPTAPRESYIRQLATPDVDNNNINSNERRYTYQERISLLKTHQKPNHFYYPNTSYGIPSPSMSQSSSSLISEMPSFSSVLTPTAPLDSIRQVMSSRNSMNQQKSEASFDEHSEVSSNSNLYMYYSNSFQNYR